VPDPATDENDDMMDEDLGVLGRTLLTERVADRIRAAILSGKLAPGERLSVPDLARRLGVSRTPAREGLLALEREGLVRPRSSAGMEVLHGSATDLRELLEVREGLEAMVARLAAERMDAAGHTALAENLAAHGAALASGDIDGHIALDEAFHSLLRTGAGNARLQRMLEQVAQQLKVLNRAISEKRGWSPAAILKDHETIAGAVTAGDPAAAEQAVRRHVRRVRRFWQGVEQRPAART